MGIETPILWGLTTWGTVYNFLIVTSINLLLGRETPKIPRDLGGSRVRIRSNTQNKLPIIYGRQEVAGSIIFADISSNNQTMYFIIALAEECSKFHSIYWNDRRLKLSATSNGTEEVANGSYSDAISGNTAPTLYHCIGTVDYDNNTNNSDALVGRIRVAMYRNGGRCSYMETNSNSWSTNASNRKMPHTCYMYVELTFNNNERITGLPNNFRAIVNGVIPDKFLENNPSGNYVRNKKADDTYITNPADCIFDYLTNKRYGAGFDIEYIDTKSLYEHKVFCNEQFFESTDTNNNQTFIPRYTTNLALDTTNTIGDNLLALTVGNGSNISWRLNKFGVVSYKYDTSVFDFSEENIVGGFNITKAGFSNKINELTVRYVDLRPSETERQITIELAESERNFNEPKLEKTVPIPSCSNTNEAKRIGNVILKRSRNDINVIFKTTMGAFSSKSTNTKAFPLKAGDIITISHKTTKWNNKLFQIETIKEIVEENFIQLEINAREYSQENYPTASNVEVSNLTATVDTSQTFNRVVLNWAINDADLVSSYRIERKLTSSSTWVTHAINVTGATTNVDRLSANTSYDFRVQAITTDNAVSEYSNVVTITTGSQSG